MSDKVVLALSGGMDSATVLWRLLQDGMEPYCFVFSYGSKHNKYENRAALKLAEHCGAVVQFVDLERAFFGMESALLKTGGDIPEGHYTDESMASTVVPARNIIFLSILAGRAESLGADKIALGIHQGDHAIYPDCRTEFFKAMDSAIYLGTGGKVEFIAPYINTDKIGILKDGLDLGVPYQLTRTCYKDQELSCGVCGSCVERLEAFEKNNILDPIKYEKGE